MQAKEGEPERREKRQQAPHRPSTATSMGSFSAVAVSLLLFLLFQLPGQAGAKPVYSAVSSADLAEFKNLLERLEEKMPLESEVPLRVRGEQNEEAGPDVPEEASWTGEVSPDQGDGAGPGPDPWDSADRSALLRNKPTAPRSLPRSSCFGGRMDRIGAHSGLGCNSFRVRRSGVGNRMGRRWGRIAIAVLAGDFYRKGTSEKITPSEFLPRLGGCPTSLRTMSSHSAVACWKNALKKKVTTTALNN
nr:natriuretic peptides A isoform X1 [Ictidomys tridecemlineatus]